MIRETHRSSSLPDGEKLGHRVPLVLVGAAMNFHALGKLAQARHPRGEIGSGLVALCIYPPGYIHKVARQATWLPLATCAAKFDASCCSGMQGLFFSAGLEPHRRLSYVALAPLLKPTQAAFCWQGIMASYSARAHDCS